MSGETTDGSKRKTLKVQVPAPLHLNLHKLKILTGETISDTVAKALSDYFENKDVPIGSA